MCCAPVPDLLVCIVGLLRWASLPPSLPPLLLLPLLHNSLRPCACCIAPSHTQKPLSFGNESFTSTLHVIAQADAREGYYYYYYYCYYHYY